MSRSEQILAERADADRLVMSALATDSAVTPTAEVLPWLAERSRAHSFEVRRVPLRELAGWQEEPGTGNLVHHTGRFFSIEGLRVQTERTWTQPIIVQPEVGVLGLVGEGVRRRAALPDARQDGAGQRPARPALADRAGHPQQLHGRAPRHADPILRVLRDRPRAAECSSTCSSPSRTPGSCTSATATWSSRPPTTCRSPTTSGGSPSASSWSCCVGRRRGEHGHEVGDVLHSGDAVGRAAPGRRVVRRHVRGRGPPVLLGRRRRPAHADRAARMADPPTRDAGGAAAPGAAGGGRGGRLAPRRRRDRARQWQVLHRDRGGRAGRQS